MTTKTTPTEKKYLQYVGKLFYNTNRKKLCMLEKLYKSYNNHYRYDIGYLGDEQMTKHIYAKNFISGIGSRFIEVTSEEHYQQLLDTNPTSVLR